MSEETCNDAEKIKSNAVVKYSVPKPAQFIQLQCNTDLNLPPSNWLSSSADSYGLQHVLFHKKGFTSFRMAQMFPDCVGNVDVVSDAENIKKLLKIPYHKGHISMMVHRVENTLLIDDFDIYKHLLRTAENEWEWLRKFFIENVNHETCEEDKHVYIQNRTREALKQKSLVSKFLYYSLAQNENVIENNIQNNNRTPLQIQEPLLPEPSPSLEAPDSDSLDQKYNRNVVWTFENIEMLLGTDMPIFGGGTYPCISLRLRDMSKPINVLTGIDYWLDNLMSNVPEVVMCYHLNGIVQKYELVKTEDLPRLDNSKFSPKVIRDVAQSILSFLKSNATKAGHTYWLFKGKDEEVIKLYDLTSLCSKDEFDNDNSQNPFTIPVAMLLYRVARNMMNSSERGQPGTIRALLENCVKLLPEEKYPEIVTSSHFMLSELYIPSDTNPESPGFNKLDEMESGFMNDIPTETDDSDVKYLDLENDSSYDNFIDNYTPPPPIVGNAEERCLKAITHISNGLNCLKFFSEATKDVLQEEVPMAKPSEPIPMPYEKLEKEGKLKKSGKKGKDKKLKTKPEPSNDLKANALLLKTKNEAQPLPTWKEKNQSDGISWKDHLKTLLYEKALVVYATLSEYHYMSGNYGSSIRCLGLLARCQQVMNKLIYTSNPLRENCLLGRAGDCCIMLVQNWTKVDTYRNQLHNHAEEDFKIMEQLENDERLHDIHISESNMKCVFLYDFRTIEQILLKAIECYQAALKSSETEGILRRLGNSLNEAGTYFLNKAKNCETEKDIYDMSKRAENYLKRGLKIFEKVEDVANVALLYTNMGHLHRLLAYASSPVKRSELTSQEKLQFNKAFTNYKKAMQILGERETNPGIWDAVNWELSTTLFNMASIMHESPPLALTKAEAEKEVVETLQKALQYCDLNENNPKFPLYQYRAAIIHLRIGSLYHNHLLSTPNDAVNRKSIIQLTKLHYEKACKLYFASNDPLNYFTTQMQRFALTEHLAETSSNPNIKIKYLQNCLDIILELKEMIDMLDKKKIEVSEEDSDKNNENYNTCYSLLNLVIQRLQHILKILTKLCSSKKIPIKDANKLTELYKESYKLTFELKQNLNYPDLVCTLNSVLEKINNLMVFYK